MSESYPTPHIAAAPEDFAKTVLMPGDPLRSKYIADTFLENSKLINNVRGVQGYTGSYKGVKVSVMASGMGMPSMGIYSYELFNFFDVENIIRVGSVGAIHKDIKLYDIILGMGACTDSNYSAQFNLPGIFAPIASYEILSAAISAADEMGISYAAGNILSSDLFYDDASSTLVWSKMGVLGVEMESAALYINAARSGKKALAICTVSDQLVTGESLTAEKRQNSFTNMIQLALETAVKLEEN